MTTNANILRLGITETFSSTGSMGSTQYTERFLGSGVLISPYLYLTAAHNFGYMADLRDIATDQLVDFAVQAAAGAAPDPQDPNSAISLFPLQTLHTSNPAADGNINFFKGYSVIGVNQPFSTDIALVKVDVPFSNGSATLSGQAVAFFMDEPWANDVTVSGYPANGGAGTEQVEISASIIGVDGSGVVNLSAGPGHGASGGAILQELGPNGEQVVIGVYTRSSATEESGVLLRYSDLQNIRSSLTAAEQGLEPSTLPRIYIYGSTNKSSSDTETIDGVEGRRNVIHGGAAKDTINGGAADDRLFGGLGQDRLTGGGGADEFYVGAGDVVLDSDSADRLFIGNDASDNEASYAEVEQPEIDREFVEFGDGKGGYLEGYNQFYFAQRNNSGVFINTGQSLVISYGFDVNRDHVIIKNYEASDLSLDIFDPARFAAEAKANYELVRFHVPKDRFILTPYLESLRSALALESLSDEVNQAGRSNQLQVLTTAETEIAGTQDIDFLQGTAADDVFVGGGELDLLLGSAGSDVYRYAAGDGDDYIMDYDGDVGDVDVLAFDDLNLTDVVFSGGGTDLYIDVPGTQRATITITNQFAEGLSEGIEEVHFANGTVLNRTQIMDALQAVRGTAGDEELYTKAQQVNGEWLPTTFFGGHGNDHIYGGDGRDTYVYASGDGNDIIEDWSDNIGTLRLSDLNPDGVSLSISSNEVVVTIGTTGETITVKPHDNAIGFDRIVFANGTVWDQADILAATLAVAITNQALVHDTGISSSDLLTRDGAVSLVGTVTAGATVEIFDSGTLLGRAFVTGTGWIFSASLGAGTHQLVAVATGAENSEARSAPAQSFVVDDTPPPSAVGNVSGILAGTNTSIIGTSEAGSIIQVSLSDAAGNFFSSLGTTTVNASGQWSLAVGPLDGKTVVVEAVDAAGNIGTTALIATDSRIVIDHAAVDVARNDISVTVEGSGNNITLEAGDALILTGANNVVTANGDGDVITLQDTGGTLTMDNGSGNLWGGVTANLIGTGNDFYLDNNDTFNVTGSGNTVKIGGGDNVVTISGGTVLVLNDDIVNTVNGSDNFVELETNDTLIVSGANNTVTADGSGNFVSLQDTGGTLTMDNSSGNLWGGITANLIGTGNEFYLDNNDTFNVTGSGNTVKIGGGDNVVTISGGTVLFLNDDIVNTVNGSGNLVMLETNHTLIVSGANNTVTADGSGNFVSLQDTGGTLTMDNSSGNLWGGITANLIGTGNDFYLDNNDTFNVTGSGNTVKIGGGDNVVAISGGTVLVLNDDIVNTVNGSGNLVMLETNDSLIVSGANNTVTADGSGNFVSLQDTGGTLTMDNSSGNLWGGITANLIGTGNDFYLDTFDTIYVTGAGNKITSGGDGNTIALSFGTVELVGATTTVNGNENTIVFHGGNSVAAAGTGETYSFDESTAGANEILAAPGSNTGTVNFGSGLNKDNLWFERDGNDLQIDVLGTSNQLTVDDWFGGANSAAVQSFRADGLTLDGQVSQLVQAMATYSANHSGFDPTSASIHAMPNDLSLQNTLASSWHG